MGFDTLAPCYDFMERIVAGGILQRSRVSWLDELSAERILLVGEGHGRFLLPLAMALPEAQITCVDASSKMLGVARERIERHNQEALARIDWVHASLPDWRPEPATYDLIATNFFLDCFEGIHLKRVVECLASGASASGHWAITDFAIPSRHSIRAMAQISLWIMYRFFRVMTGIQSRTLESPFPLVAGLGFKKLRSRDALGGFVTSQLWQRI